jgi:hypothetical protein
MSMPAGTNSPTGSGSRPGALAQARSIYDPGLWSWIPLLETSAICDDALTQTPKICLSNQSLDELCHVEGCGDLGNITDSIYCH